MVLPKNEVEIGNPGRERFVALASWGELVRPEVFGRIENFVGLAGLRCELMGKGETYGFQICHE
jgi:hypothetical protein